MQENIFLQDKLNS